MFRFFAIGIVFCLFQFFCPEPLIADIFVISGSREVAAAATGAPSDGAMTMLPGMFAEEAMALGMTMAGTIGSSASQASTTPVISGPSIGGTGSAEVFAIATGLTGFSNSASSTFDVSFGVTATGFYRLDASVDWMGAAPPPYGGAASVELFNVTDAFAIDSVFSTPGSPGVHEIDDFYMLEAGDVYVLLATVDIGGGFDLPGEYFSAGSWSFTLTIPEPGTTAILLPVLGCVVSRRNRSS